MQTGIQASLAIAREAELLSQLPSWVDRSTCALSESKGNTQLTFYCCCSVRKLQARVRDGRDTSETAAKLAKNVSRRHDACQPSEKTGPNQTIPPAQLPAESRGVQLEKSLSSTKRKLSQTQGALEQSQAKAARAQAAVSADSERKRQETLAANRRVDIDPESKEAFTAANKSTAMNAEGTGVVAAIKCWAQGSVEKVFQLLLSIMAVFGLQQRMAEHLMVEAEGTNAEMVSRLHDSVQILKRCESEEPRQQHRIVLTAAAPVLVDKGDSTGMLAKFADALGINRKSVPLTQSVVKRQEIDVAAKKLDLPLQVGDVVCCKHGTGTLVEYAGKDGPCAVLLDLEGIEHTARFQHPKNTPGGGRVRRLPISFAPKPRATRSDKLPGTIKKQVAIIYSFAILEAGCNATGPNPL